MISGHKFFSVNEKLKMDIVFIVLLCIVGGLAAKEKEDFRNQTIECSFREIGKCLSTVAQLGGNFSVRYAEKAADLNRTCLPKEAFKLCVQSVPGLCNYVYPSANPAISSIMALVTKLCTNKSAEQNNFLNSSICYNKNQNTRQQCVQKYASGKIDAKSLCCDSKKTQECLKEDMKKVCSSNSTVFQDSLIYTYSGYTNLLCGPYREHCGAVGNFLSVACLLLTVKLTVLNFLS